MYTLIIIYIHIEFLSYSAIATAIWHWAGGGEGYGSERNGTEWILSLRQGRHAIGGGGHRIQKARYHWPGSVGARVVGAVGGGMGTGSEREGGGVFFTADLC